MKLITAVSTVADGNMSLKWGERADVEKNRKKFLERNGLTLGDCVFTSLVHGVDVAIVGERDREKIVEADGLITGDKHVALWMMTGDCLPVVFYEPSKNILGLAHLGWRGVDKNLAQIMVKRLVELGCESEKTKVWIGPGVRKETYWKYGEGIDSFKQSVNIKRWESFLESKSKGELALDLVGFVKQQLVEEGVPIENIEVSAIDTVKDRNYFSQYRSVRNNEPEGRFATVVMMENQ